MTHEQEALAAYTMLAYDAAEFVEYAQSISSEAKELLKLMLTTPNEKQTRSNAELNKFGAQLLGYV